MSPGNKVVSGRSMTCAPAGACVDFSGPTPTMWLPSTVTTHPVCIGSPSVHTRAGRSTNDPGGSAARPQTGSAAKTTTQAAIRDFSELCMLMRTPVSKASNHYADCCTAAGIAKLTNDEMTYLSSDLGISPQCMWVQKVGKNSALPATGFTRKFCR